MPACQGITGEGFRCPVIARGESEYCGRHKNADRLSMVRKIYKRYTYLRALDYNYRCEFQRGMMFEQHTVEEALRICAHVETRIRPDYPGYTGEFRKSFAEAINASRPLSAYERALSRIPVGLRHSRRNFDGWYAHFYHHVELVIDNHGVIPVPTYNELYTPTYITNTLAPELLVIWVAIHNDIKFQFHRCFRNLRMFGQTEIGELENILPLPPQVNNFTTDSQNVHRKSTVDYVTETYNQLVKVQVPPGQNTVGTIIMKCKLEGKAIIQLTQYYYEPASIYEIPNAYPKALDAVVAFTEQHPQKEELYNRIRDELTDNVGMCAQGNLSRICNIVMGYMDGIKPPVPKGTLIQNAVAAIASDEEGNKIERCKQALRELDVPEQEWQPWIDALT